MVDRITPTIQQFAKLVQEAYKEESKRARSFDMVCKNHIYRPEKSNDLWCWYEDKNVILLGLHGVNDFRLTQLSIGQFFDQDKLEPEIEKFCDIHKQLSDTAKTVFLAAHSLGAWILISCQFINNDKNIEGVLFAPYAPSKGGHKIDIMASSTRFKKIFYDNDWIASNLLKNDSLSNTIVLTPRTIPSTFLNGHTLDNFADSNIELMNVDIKRFIKGPGNVEEKELIGNILSSRPKELDEFMKLKGHLKIKSLNICRAPINLVYGKIVNFLTGGRLEENQKKFNYDNLYHLYAIITFENGEVFSVEKTQIVFVGNFEESREGECKSTNVNSSKSFTEVIEDLEIKLGDNLYRYDMAKYNCQNFLLNFVNDLGITGFDDFIYQDVKGIFSPVISGILGVITDIGGLFQRIFSPSIRLDLPPPPVEEKKGNGKTSINIMSYNLKMLSSVILDLVQSKRAGWIPDEIMKRHPEIEILVCQELFDEPAEKVLDKGMKKNGFTHISKKVGSGTGGVDDLLSFGVGQISGSKKQNKIEDGGVKIYSKYPIISQEEIVYSVGNKADAIAKKGAVRIVIEKDGVRMNIIGTHLQSGRLTASLDTKRVQLDELADFMKKSEGEPTFVFGDMNMDYYALQDFLVENLRKHKLKIMGQPVGFTSNTDFGQNNDNWLDYCFTPITNDINLEGGIEKVFVKRDAGYEYDRNPEIWDFGSEWKNNYRKIKNEFEDIENEFNNVLSAGKDLFRNKKQKRKAQERKERKKERLEEKRKIARAKFFGTAYDLSDHHPIKIKIDIGGTSNKPTNKPINQKPQLQQGSRI